LLAVCAKHALPVEVRRVSLGFPLWRHSDPDGACLKIDSLLAEAGRTRNVLLDLTAASRARGRLPGCVESGKMSLTPHKCTAREARRAAEGRVRLSARPHEAVCWLPCSAAARVLALLLVLRERCAVVVEGGLLERSAGVLDGGRLDGIPPVSPLPLPHSPFHCPNLENLEADDLTEMYVRRYGQPLGKSPAAPP